MPRTTDYEGGSPGEYRKIDDTWVPAQDVIDERVLIFNLRNKGLFIFTACGHTGVVNATKHACKLTGISQVHCIMGGFHLASSQTEERITPTINDLQKINPDYLFTGHCTGAKTQAKLSEVFGQRHSSYGVGTVFKISVD